MRRTNSIICSENHSRSSQQALLIQRNEAMVSINGHIGSLQRKTDKSDRLERHAIQVGLAYISYT